MTLPFLPENEIQPMFEQLRVQATNEMRPAEAVRKVRFSSLRIQPPLRAPTRLLHSEGRDNKRQQAGRSAERRLYSQVNVSETWIQSNTWPPSSWSVFMIGQSEQTTT